MNIESVSIHVLIKLFNLRATHDPHTFTTHAKYMIPSDKTLIISQVSNVLLPPH